LISIENSSKNVFFVFLELSVLRSATQLTDKGKNKDLTKVN